jgi:hypothetical protein
MVLSAVVEGHRREPDQLFRNAPCWLPPRRVAKSFGNATREHVAHPVATDANYHSVTSAIGQVVIHFADTASHLRFAITNQNLELTFTQPSAAATGKQSEKPRTGEWTSVGISQVATGTSLSVLCRRGRAAALFPGVGLP